MAIAVIAKSVHVDVAIFATGHNIAGVVPGPVGDLAFEHVIGEDFRHQGFGQVFAVPFPVGQLQKLEFTDLKLVGGLDNNKPFLHFLVIVVGTNKRFPQIRKRTFFASFGHNTRPYHESVQFFEETAFTLW